MLDLGIKDLIMVLRALCNCEKVAVVVKMHLMLCLALTLNQQVIKINDHEFAQHIIKA